MTDKAEIPPKPLSVEIPERDRKGHLMWLHKNGDRY